MRARETLARARSLIPHKASPRQLEFLALDCEEALYGGAAGGGKSDALLMDALRFVDVPGYSAAIFRRTKVEALMADAPLARARLWLEPAIAAGLCRWDEESSTFEFQTSGAPALLHFGYLAREADQLRYQGAAWQFIGVDELTGWGVKNYLFLFSRIRTTSTLARPVPLRMRSTTNPGGPGHAWVRDRFVAGARHVLTGSECMPDLKRRREKGTALPPPAVYVSPPSSEALELAKETGRPAQGAHFVPAFVQDNPALTGEHLAAYRANLRRLDPVRRAQLEWGDWEAVGGGQFFQASAFELVEGLPANIRSWCRSWDLAATEAKPNTDPDWTVGAKVGTLIEPLTKASRVVVPHVVRFREDPGETDRRIKATAQLDGKRVPQLIEQEPGSAGKRGIRHFATQLLFGWRVEGIRKTGPKEEYWRPLASLARVAPIILVRSSSADDTWIRELIEELTAIPVGHDDQADAVSQGYAWLTEGGTSRERLRALASS